MQRIIYNSGPDCSDLKYLQFVAMRKLLKTVIKIQEKGRMGGYESSFTP